MIVRHFFIKLACLPCQLFALCPEHLRFAWMCKVARLFWPLFRLLAVCKINLIPIQGYRETALAALVYLLIKLNIPFKQMLRMEPPDIFRDTAGVLLITVHLNLNRLLIRELSGQGRRVNIVTKMPDVAHYLGQNLPHEVISPDAQSLVQIRRKVNAGEVVYLTVEMMEPNSNCQPLQIGAEKYFISAVPFAFAERAQIPLLFVAAYVDNEGQPNFTCQQPSTQKADIAFNEFCSFIATEGTRYLRA